MALTIQQVRDHVNAFLKTIQGMSQKEKENSPTKQYGEQYNNALTMAKEVQTGVDARLWPPAVWFYKGSDYMDITNSHYAEIETYLRQILNHLHESK